MGKGAFSPVEKKQERNSQNRKGDKNGDSGSGPDHVDEYVVAPDGGWGWMVVLSSFFIHVIADGIVYSFGVFLEGLMEYFQAGSGAVSFIGALQPGVTFTVGPLSSVLTNMYGCRKVTIIGAVIAAFGFVISAWAPNLYYLYLTSGIIAGVGFGLIYLPAIVSVTQYFEKRRSFATGLAVCGSGVGTFILAPVTKLLLQEYSWRGAMLILGGIILNVIVCGIIFRPLEPAVRATREISLVPEEEALLGTADTGRKSSSGEDIELLEKAHGNVDKSRGEEPEMLTAEETFKIVSSFQQLKALPNGTTILVNDVSVQELPKNKDTASLEISPNGIQNSKKISGDSEKGNVYQLSLSQCIVAPEQHQNAASFARSDSALHKQPVTRSAHNENLTSPRKRTPRSSESSHGSSSGLSPLHRKDIFYSGSLQNIPMYRSQPDVYKATVSAVHIEDARSQKSGDGAEKRGAFNDFFVEFRSTMKDMLSVTLLLNPVFLIFALSNFFTSIGFNVPFIFLPHRAKQSNIDEHRAALLLSVIGIANTVGRVIFGFLSDRSGVNRLMLYNTALTICGVATALCPLLGGNYSLLVVYAAVFGLFIGVYVSLTSVVLVDLLGLDHLTNSFGLLLLFQGAATFMGPWIAGKLYDKTGSYDISFIVMGTLIAFSGAMLYFLPGVERYYQRWLPKETIVRDMELGKIVVATDGLEIISIEQIPSQT